MRDEVVSAFVLIFSIIALGVSVVTILYLSVQAVREAFKTRARTRELEVELEAEQDYESRVLLKIPAELWDDFSACLYVLSNHRDRPFYEGDEKAFEWRAQVEIRTDSMMVLCICRKPEMEAYLKNTVDNVNAHADWRTIESYSGVPGEEGGEPWGSR